jgi:nucleoside-diphosphate-sugar epimerase
LENIAFTWSLFRASGFIGLPVAQAFVRAGHVVYGLTRSQAKAKLLSAEESKPHPPPSLLHPTNRCAKVIPVVGELDNPEPWLQLIPTLDAVIDIIGGSADIRTLSKALLETTSNAAKSTRPAYAPKLTYIYTSGTWVHGEDRVNLVTDSTPCNNPAELVAWRVEQEQWVIKDPVLNGIVIRPALLYGRSGSLFAPLFKSASEGRVAWYGRPGGRYALIHCDDAADLFLRAAEKAQVVGGNIFDGANDQTESVDDFLQKLVEVSGAKGPYEYIPPSNRKFFFDFFFVNLSNELWIVYETALSTTSLLRPYLARTLLGWRPLKAGLTDGLPTYYAAYLASTGQ